MTSSVPLLDEEGGPNLVELAFNATAKLKFKGEELKSAQIRSLGVLSQFSNDSFFLFGKGKITLTRVPVEKLPFVPELVMVKSVTEPAALPVRPAAMVPTPTAPATESAQN